MQKLLGQFGNTLKTTYDYVDSWLSKKGGSKPGVKGGGSGGGHLTRNAAQRRTRFAAMR